MKRCWVTVSYCSVIIRLVVVFLVRASVSLLPLYHANWTSNLPLPGKEFIIWLDSFFNVPACGRSRWKVACVRPAVIHLVQHRQWLICLSFINILLDKDKTVQFTWNDLFTTFKAIETWYDQRWCDIHIVRFISVRCPWCLHAALVCLSLNHRTTSSDSRQPFPQNEVMMKWIATYLSVICLFSREENYI